MTSKPKDKHWETNLNGQTSSKHWIMNKLETARRLARQTAGQGQNTEKEKPEDPRVIDQIAKILELIMNSQKTLNRNQQALVDGIKRKLTPLENLEKRMLAMENSIMNLAKQQEKTRKLMM